MSTRWYTGSCQCGRVKFEAAVDLEAHAAKPSANPFVLIRPGAFRLICGEQDLSDVQFGTGFGLNRFCRFCGIRVFGKGHLAKLGGDFCAVAVSALDGTVEEAAAAAAAVAAAEAAEAAEAAQ
jgi:hypothetical protein